MYVQYDSTQVPLPLPLYTYKFFLFFIFYFLCIIEFLFKMQYAPLHKIHTFIYTYINTYKNKKKEKKKKKKKAYVKEIRALYGEHFICTKVLMQRLGEKSTRKLFVAEGIYLIHRS